MGIMTARSKAKFEDHEAYQGYIDKREAARAASIQTANVEGEHTTKRIEKFRATVADTPGLLIERSRKATLTKYVGPADAHDNGQPLTAPVVIPGIGHRRFLEPISSNITAVDMDPKRQKQAVPKADLPAAYQHQHEISEADNQAMQAISRRQVEAARARSRRWEDTQWNNERHAILREQHQSAQPLA